MVQINPETLKSLLFFIDEVIVILERSGMVDTAAQIRIQREQIVTIAQEEPRDEHGRVPAAGE